MDEYFNIDLLRSTIRNKFLTKS